MPEWDGDLSHAYLDSTLTQDDLVHHGTIAGGAVVVLNVNIHVPATALYKGERVVRDRLNLVERTGCGHADPQQDDRRNQSQLLHQDDLLPAVTDGARSMCLTGSPPVVSTDSFPVSLACGAGEGNGVDPVFE